MHLARLASYGVNPNMVHPLEIHKKREEMTNVDRQTLVANNTVPYVCTTQWTTVQDTANSTCKDWRATSHDLYDVPR